MLFLSSVAMAQQATVTATITPYAGGSVVARFQAQGGGSPSITQTSGPINSSGQFSLTAWNNAYAGYGPSVTSFTICVGASPATCYTTSVSISGSSQDISAAFSGAPSPPSGGGSLPNAPAAGYAPVATAPGTGSYTAQNINSAANTGIVYAAPNCGIQTNCYPIKDDGQIVWQSANWSAGSPNVNCPACTFTSADVGKIFFGTNASHFGYYFQLTSVVTCGQTTIASVTDSHDIVLAANCSAASGGDSPIIWGSDDSAALAAAWNATVASCTTLQLPGGNAQGNGPAVMLVQQAEFNTASGTPSRATCSLGTEALRSGLGLRGVDISSTVIVPTPNFSFTTCTFGFSGNGCFGSINDGGNLSDFTIWGAGNSAPTGVGGHYVMDIDAQVAVSPTSGNNALHHVVLMGWGAGTVGFEAGLRLEGGTTVCDGVDVDGVGLTGVQVVSGLNSCTQLQAYDNQINNLAVIGSGTVFSSFGGNYGITALAGNGCDIATSNGATLNSFGDLIGANLTAITGENGACPGYVDNAITSGSINLYASYIEPGVTAGSSAVFIAGNGSTLRAWGSTLIGTNSIYNQGAYVDLGGNAITGTYTCSSCVSAVGVTLSPITPP